MATDLETLRSEIQEYLTGSELAIFHGYAGFEDRISVYWDTDKHPDFRPFLQAAEKAGAKLVVLHHQVFALDDIDEILEEIAEANLSREERKQYEVRIRELQKYEGFTCGVELSFVVDGRVYAYHKRTDWYLAWEEIVNELDALMDADEDSEEDGSMPGYYSAN